MTPPAARPTPPPSRAPAPNRAVGRLLRSAALALLPALMPVGARAQTAPTSPAVPAPVAPTPAASATPQAPTAPDAPTAPEAAAPAQPPASAPAPEASASAPITPPGQVGAPDATPARPAFDIEVHGPDASLRQLVERHLPLQRYRALNDLDATEMQRLLALAERDVRNLLGTEGYFSPDVRIAQQRGPAGRPLVRIDITPGPATTVGRVDLAFEGDLGQTGDADAQAQAATLRADWGLPVGERFTQAGWSGAKKDALRTLTERRYPRGRIAYSLADVDAPAARATLGLRLDSGPPFFLGPAQVRGAQRYPDWLPERLSWLKPGEVYDQKRLVEAQQRLAGSGYYESALIGIDTEGEPAAVPLIYTVQEAKLQRVRLGVGYSTDDGPRLSIEHRHNRVFGSSWRADSTLRVNRRTPLVQTELTGLPNADGWRWGGLGRWERYDDGALTTTAQALRFGRSHFGERYDRQVYLQFDRATVQGRGAADNSNAAIGDGAALSLNYDWTGRYFDNVTNPTRGHGLRLNLGAGTTLVGRKLPFARVQARWLGLLPLGEGGSRLALRSDIGAVLANTQARLPATYLFRTGGNASVRGYGFRDIGITLPDGSTGPGRYMGAASIEWQRPILQERFGKLLEHALFIDVGGVADRPQQWRPSWGVGTGVRMNTPVGPMQLDVAWGLKSKTLRLHMNVGFVF